MAKLTERSWVQGMIDKTKMVGTVIMWMGYRRLFQIIAEEMKYCEL